MTPQQLDAIPDDLLTPSRHGTGQLVSWLRSIGWRMTLAELDAERRRRGLIGRTGVR